MNPSLFILLGGRPWTLGKGWALEGRKARWGVSAQSMRLWARSPACSQRPCVLQAQGVVKDLEPELLRHLAQGTAYLLITTKGSPKGELGRQVGGIVARRGILQSAWLRTMALWGQLGCSCDPLHPLLLHPLWLQGCCVLGHGAWGVGVMSHSLLLSGAHRQPVPGRRPASGGRRDFWGPCSPRCSSSSFASCTGPRHPTARQVWGPREASRSQHLLFRGATAPSWSSLGTQL